MPDRPTPLTDAATIHVWWDIDAQSWCGIDDDGYFVPVETARTLERDRGELEAEVQKLILELGLAYGGFATLPARHSARQAIEKASALLSRLRGEE